MDQLKNAARIWGPKFAKSYRRREAFWQWNVETEYKIVFVNDREAELEKYN